MPKAKAAKSDNQTDTVDKMDVDANEQATATKHGGKGKQKETVKNKGKVRSHTRRFTKF
jgi:hypothetical protein